MKIYYFGIFNAGGGLEKFAKETISYARKNGANVCLLVTSNVFSYKDYFASIGCEFVVLPNWKKNPFRYIKLLKKTFHSSDKLSSIIHLNVCSLRNFPLLFASKKSGLKTIITSHYSKLQFGRGLFFHKLNKILFKNFSLKTAVSKDAYDFMFVDHNYSNVIENSIDSSLYSFDEEKRMMIRNEYCIGKNTFVIAQIGRLYHDKNPTFSLKVFEKLKSKYNNISLYYVGSETELETRELAIRKSLSDVFFVGKVQKDIDAWYSAADLLVLPSLNEAASLTLLESMANGINIVCSKNVQPLDVENNTTHFLELDEELWVNNISNIIASNCINISRKNWLTGTKYDKQEAQKRYWELYERCLRKDF